jgi:hypothetical protein
MHVRIARASRPLALLAATLLALSLAVHQGACVDSIFEPSTTKCTGTCDKCGCPEGQRCVHPMSSWVPVCQAW